MKNKKIIACLIFITILLFIAGVGNLLMSSDYSVASTKINNEKLIENGYAFGDSDAPIKMIEYTNFQCTYCKNQHSELKEEVERLINDGQLYYLMKHVSIEDNKNAEIVNERVNAISDKDSQLSAINRVFIEQEQWSEKNAGELERYLENTNLQEKNTVKIKGILASEVKNLGISATPTTIINGQKFQGAIKKEEFLKYIEAELE
ncbi:DsbA family protein (plasmid) [Bacillus sp. F19]|nr:DsbA family protein [Bacillus sp. F19]